MRRALPGPWGIADRRRLSVGGADFATLPGRNLHLTPSQDPLYVEELRPEEVLTGALEKTTGAVQRGVRRARGRRPPSPAPRGTSDGRVGQCVSLGSRRSGRGRGTRPIPGLRQPEMGKGCSSHDLRGRDHRTGRGGPGDSLQRLAVYHGKGTKACPARSRKRGCRRSSGGLVRRAIQTYAAR